ncbi:MAG: ketoacyl-ACP synthase III [Akkermansiaceae bacterium]|nr:ketoacyl-ACP synthase III [Akkermansiaceae bacterium]
MKTFIKAISYYLPKRIQTNDALVSKFPEWNAAKVSEKVGVNSRHISASDETAGDMAEKAARKLFFEYNINPEDIDFILFCTQSPDYFLPSTSCVLQNRLGLKTTCGAFDFNLGCSGAVYGLAIAKGMITSRVARNVLLLTAETYTKYLHPSDKSNQSIFGDGAAACLISYDGLFEIGEFVLGTDGSGAENLILRSGAARCKQSTGFSEMDENGYTRWDDYLYMNGNAIFNFTLSTVPHLVSETLLVNSLSKEEVDYFVFHQANKFMLDSIRKVCKIPETRFYNSIEHTGNTVSSTVLIALKDAIQANLITPGMKIMLAGFGVGLSYGACILR